MWYSTPTGQDPITWWTLKEMSCSIHGMLAISKNIMSRIEIVRKAELHKYKQMQTFVFFFFVEYKDRTLFLIEGNSKSEVRFLMMQTLM
jgi:hypothetical protein